MIKKHIFYIIALYAFTSKSSLGMEEQVEKGASSYRTLKTVQTVTDVALSTIGHRTSEGFLSQGNHRSPSEWWNQGNHRSVSEWFSGETSKNSRNAKK